MGQATLRSSSCEMIEPDEKGAVSKADADRIASELSEISGVMKDYQKLFDMVLDLRRKEASRKRAEMEVSGSTSSAQPSKRFRKQN